MICLGVESSADGVARFCADAYAGIAVHEVLRANHDHPAGKEGDELTVVVPCNSKSM
jgi:hypothetical protein